MTTGSVRGKCSPRQAGQRRRQPPFSMPEAAPQREQKRCVRCQPSSPLAVAAIDAPSGQSSPQTLRRSMNLAPSPKRSRAASSSSAEKSAAKQGVSPREAEKDRRFRRLGQVLGRRDPAEPRPLTGLRARPWPRQIDQHLLLPERQQRGVGAAQQLGRRIAQVGGAVEPSAASGEGDAPGLDHGLTFEREDIRAP